MMTMVMKIIIIICIDDSDDDLKIMKMMTMMIKERCVCSVEFVAQYLIAPLSD